MLLPSAMGLEMTIGYPSPTQSSSVTEMGSETSMQTSSRWARRSA